ncbi:hypothetical protein KQI88_15965 [Alkaliphilus sp. MSJ-5]|uniref:Phage-related protein n=1 Tax=Alkaliphilus flagellatus TaxID=2841507 RepID=A0ABS6G6Z2_9FIRM|nr:hypothetical protein [Alkaliphilus flagellatus]MBU5677914.1 hypothetical protein [Alkaliphilus flagellatus]
MTIEELRVIISAKTEKLQEGINKATSRLNSFRESTNETSNTVNQNVQRMREQYDSLVRKLDIVNAQAETQQRKLNALRERYSSVSALNNDSPAALRLQEQIVNTEARLERLVNTSDRTANSIHQLEDSMANTSNATQNANSGISSLRDTVSNASNRVRQATNNTRRLGREINTTGERAKQSTGKIAGFAKMIDSSFRRILKRIFIYNLIYKAIRGLIGYMGGALKTNNQFADSIQTIKTNLRVAFQPIYDFILPAINALMNALATVSTYIASFTSALFGKTYKQSYDAAKGIETAKKEMDGYGKSAKKAKGQLAGFDEVNQLDLSKDDEGSGGTNEFEMSMPDISSVDMSGIEELKQNLSELFQPFKDAWDNEGARTIESAKNAFNSVKALILEIGKSFKEVWTGGSGQQILEILQRILQNIFDLVGRIAENFRIAWSENETGTKIIQGIADIFNIILGVIESIGESLNKVWGEIGQDVANTFMSIIEATIEVLKTLAEGLKAVWDNGGQHLFESLIKLGAKVFELAGYIYTEFVAPFVSWFIELISPAISKVLDVVADLLDTFTELIDWLLSDGKPTLDIIVTVLGSMAAAFGIVKGAIAAKAAVVTAYNAVMFIASNVTGIFAGVLAFLTSPITLAVAAIGTLIAIGVLLYKNWDEISVWIKDLWEGIKIKAEEIWSSIAIFFSDTWNGIKTTTQNIWTNIKSFILNKWSEIRQGITNMKSNLIDAIKSPFNIAKDWIDDLIKDAFDWGKNLIGNIVDGIKSMGGKVKESVSGVANTIGDFLGFHSPSKKGPGADADRWMPNLMNMLADGIEDNVYKVSGAVDVTANALRGIETSNNSDSIASAVGSAVMAAMQFNNSQSSQGQDGDMVIQIDGTTLARIVKPYLEKEQQRIGGSAILQTT